MQKTTVYLSEDEVEGLRRLSAETGVSRSDLIRRGVRTVIGEQRPERTFHSLGIGASGGTRPRRWSAEELYDKAFGRR